VSRRALWPLVLGAALVLAAATALAGWLAGGVATNEPAPKAPDLQPARVGSLDLQVSGEWKAVPGGRDVKGFEPGSALTFAPIPGLSLRALVALAPAEHTSLVPGPLRDRLSDPLPKPTQARLAGAPAWTYTMSGSERRDGLLEITVVPTTAGVLSVACVGSVSSASSVCGAGVRRLDLNGARSLHPAPDLAFRERLSTVVDRLDSQRVALRRELRGSPDGRGQAAVAGRLALAHRDAAGGLAPFATPTGPTADLLGALRTTADAYERLAAAAGQGSTGDYDAARRDVGRGDAEVTEALSRFAAPDAGS